MHVSVTMPCRNEDWIVGLTARAVLRFADSLVILDHASTDRTPEIIADVVAEHPGRVVAIHEPDPTWAEMTHRQRLLDTSRAIGATHIAIVDADELLTGNLLSQIRPLFESMRPRNMLQLPWLMCWRSVDHYRNGDASAWSQNAATVGFQDAADLYWQIPDGDYCFHHRHPRGRTLQPWQPVLRSSGGLLHFQHASWRRLLAKQALYQVQEVLRWPGRVQPERIAAMYGGTVNEDGLRTSPIPREWFEPYADLMHHLKVDAEPWQEAEVRRLVVKHGMERFAGLNLFGVAEASCTAR